MVDEGKLRAKIGKILERPAYRGLWTYSRQPLIDRIVEAVKECEEAEAVAEEEAVTEEEATVEAAVTEEQTETKKSKKRR